MLPLFVYVVELSVRDFDGAHDYFMPIDCYATRALAEVALGAHADASTTATDAPTMTQTWSADSLDSAELYWTDSAEPEWSQLFGRVNVWRVN